MTTEGPIKATRYHGSGVKMMKNILTVGRVHAMSIGDPITATKIGVG